MTQNDEHTPENTCQFTQNNHFVKSAALKFNKQCNLKTSTTQIHSKQIISLLLYILKTGSMIRIIATIDISMIATDRAEVIAQKLAL
jgi:hypothetical protein